MRINVLACDTCYERGKVERADHSFHVKIDKKAGKSLALCLKHAQEVSLYSFLNGAPEAPQVAQKAFGGSKPAKSGDPRSVKRTCEFCGATAGGGQGLSAHIRAKHLAKYPAWRDEVRAAEAERKKARDRERQRGKR